MTETSTTPVDSERRTFVTAAAITLVVIVVWAALASRRPTATFHFAPLIAAGAGPWLVQNTLGRQSSGVAMRLALTCFGLVAAATLVLAAAGTLDGPTFWSDSGAWYEGLIFAAIGAAIGWRVVRRDPAAVAS